MAFSNLIDVYEEIRRRLAQQQQQQQQEPQQAPAPAPAPRPMQGPQPRPTNLLYRPPQQAQGPQPRPLPQPQRPMYGPPTREQFQRQENPWRAQIDAVRQRAQEQAQQSWRQMWQQADDVKKEVIASGGTPAAIAQVLFGSNQIESGTYRDRTPDEIAFYAEHGYWPVSDTARNLGPSAFNIAMDNAVRTEEANAAIEKYKSELSAIENPVMRGLYMLWGGTGAYGRYAGTKAWNALQWTNFPADYLGEQEAPDVYFSPNPFGPQEKIVETEGRSINQQLVPYLSVINKLYGFGHRLIDEQTGEPIDPWTAIKYTVQNPEKLWNIAANEVERQHARFDAINDQLEQVRQSDPQLYNILRLATPNAIGEASWQENTLEWMTAKYNVDEMYAQAEGLMQRGMQEEANDLYNKAKELEGMSYSDIINKWRQPSATLMQSMFLDPTNFIPTGWIGDLRGVGKVLNMAGEAVDSAGIAKYVQEGEEVLNAIQTGTGKIAPSARSYGGPMATWAVLGKTPDSRAAIDSNILTSAAARLFAGVSDPEDFRQLFQTWVNDPEGLVKGITNLVSPALQSQADSAGKVFRGSAGVIGKNVLERNAILRLVEPRLNDMDAMKPGQFSVERAVAELDDLIYEASRQAHGLVALDELPYGAATISRQGDTLTFLGDEGQFIGTRQYASPAEASKMEKAIREAATSRGEQNPFRGVWNAVRVLDKTQRAAMSALWLNLRPGHMFRNAFGATGALGAEGILTFEHMDSILDGMQAKAVLGLTERGLQGALDAMGKKSRIVSGWGTQNIQRSQHPNRIVRMAQDAMRGVHWQGNNNLFGRIPYGEQAFYTRGLWAGFQKSFNPAWRRVVKEQNNYRNVLKSMGLSDEAANTLLDIATEAGINGGRTDIAEAMRSALYVQGGAPRYTPLTPPPAGVAPSSLGATTPPAGAVPTPGAAIPPAGAMPSPAAAAPSPGAITPPGTTTGAAAATARPGLLTFPQLRIRPEDISLKAARQIQGLMNRYNAGRMNWQDFAEAANKILDTDELGQGAVLLHNPTSPGRHAWQSKEVVEESAYLADEIYSAALRATGDPVQARAMVRQIVEPYLTVERETLKAISDFVKAGADPRQSAAVAVRAWSELYDMRAALRNRVDSITRAAIGGNAGAWKKRMDGIAAEYARHAENAKGLLEKVKSGQYAGEDTHIWNLIQRALRYDQAAMSNIASGAGQAEELTEFAKYLDQSYTGLTQAVAMHPSPDSIDILLGTIQKNDEMGSQFGAYLTQLADAVREGTLSTDQAQALRFEAYKNFYRAIGVNNHASARTVFLTGSKPMDGATAAAAAGRRAVDEADALMESVAGKVPDLPGAVPGRARITLAGGAEEVRVRQMMDKLPHDARIKEATLVEWGARARNWARMTGLPSDLWWRRIAEVGQNPYPGKGLKQPGRGNWTGLEIGGAPLEPREFVTGPERDANFQKFFEGSAVTGEYAIVGDKTPGKPLRMYRGTRNHTIPYDAEDMSKIQDGLFGPGIYYTDNPDIAAGKVSGGVTESIPWSSEESARRYAKDLLAADNIDPKSIVVRQATEDEGSDYWTWFVDYKEKPKLSDPGYASQTLEYDEPIDSKALAEFWSDKVSYSFVDDYFSNLGSRTDKMNMRQQIYDELVDEGSEAGAVIEALRQRRLSDGPLDPYDINKVANQAFWSMGKRLGATDPDMFAEDMVSLLGKALKPGFVQRRMEAPTQTFADYLNIKNPFDIDKTYSRAEMEQLFGNSSMGTGLKVIDANANGIGPGSAMTGEQIYDALRRHAGGGFPYKILKDAGFDGITHIGGGRTAHDPHRVFIAFRPEQAKSVYGNVGTFDPTNPSRLMQEQGEEVLGWMGLMEDGRRVYNILQNGDASTFAHETGHMFLFDLQEAAKYSDKAAEDLEYVKAWAKVVGDEWTEEAHELFARTYEEWRRTGKAPIPELEGVFEQFKQWLVEIYRRITQSGVVPDNKIDKRISEVYGNLLTPDAYADGRLMTNTRYNPREATPRWASGANVDVAGVRGKLKKIGDGSWSVDLENGSTLKNVTPETPNLTLVPVSRSPLRHPAEQFKPSAYEGWPMAEPPKPATGDRVVPSLDEITTRQMRESGLLDQAALPGVVNMLNSHLKGIIDPDTPLTVKSFTPKGWANVPQEDKFAISYYMKLLKAEKVELEKRFLLGKDSAEFAKARRRVGNAMTAWKAQADAAGQRYPWIPERLEWNVHNPMAQRRVGVPHPGDGEPSLYDRDTLTVNRLLGLEPDVEDANVLDETTALMLENAGTQADPTFGDVASSGIRVLAQARRNLSAQPAGVQIQVTPAQAKAIMDMVTGKMLPEFDNIVAGATKVGERLADAAMLNGNDRRYIDGFLSTIMPYHFFWTRSARNWAGRTLRKPRWTNLYESTERSQELYEQQEGNVNNRYEGLAQIGTTDEGEPIMVQNPLNWVFPWIQLGQGNQFVDQNRGNTEFEKVYNNYLYNTAGMFPTYQLILNDYLDRTDPLPDGDKRANWDIRTYIPQVGNMANISQMLTGKSMPFGIPETYPVPFGAQQGEQAGVGVNPDALEYNIGNEAARQDVSGGMTTEQAAYVQQFAYNQRNGRPLFENIPPDQLQETAIRALGVEKGVGVEMFLGNLSYWLGLNLRVKPKEDVTIRQMQDEYNTLGYAEDDPNTPENEANPYGGKGLKQDYLEQNPEMYTIWNRGGESDFGAPAVQLTQRQAWAALNAAYDAQGTMLQEVMAEAAAATGKNGILLPEEIRQFEDAVRAEWSPVIEELKALTEQLGAASDVTPEQLRSLPEGAPFPAQGPQAAPAGPSFPEGPQSVEPTGPGTGAMEQALSSGQFQLPFDPAKLSQKYGTNPARYARFDLAGHEGLDWIIPEGTVINPVADGTVSRTGFDKTGYGNYVVVAHNDGSETLYAHLDSISVKKGQPVTLDTLLGKSGNTGNSDAPHLHFGWRPDAGVTTGPMKGWADPMGLQPQAQAQPQQAPQPSGLPMPKMPSLKDMNPTEVRAALDKWAFDAAKDMPGRPDWNAIVTEPKGGNAALRGQQIADYYEQRDAWEAQQMAYLNELLAATPEGAPSNVPLPPTGPKLLEQWNKFLTQYDTPQEKASKAYEAEYQAWYKKNIKPLYEAKEWDKAREVWQSNPEYQSWYERKQALEGKELPYSAGGDPGAMVRNLERGVAPEGEFQEKVAQALADGWDAATIQAFIDYDSSWDDATKAKFRQAHPELTAFWDYWYDGVPKEQALAQMGSGYSVQNGRIAYWSDDGLVSYDRYGRRLDSIGNVARGFYGGGSGGGWSGGGSGGAGFNRSQVIQIDPRRRFTREIFFNKWNPMPDMLGQDWFYAGQKLGPEKVRGTGAK